MAMVLYKRAETTVELKQILELQEKNLLSKLSDKEKEKEGFLTVKHSFAILEQMNRVCPHIIAVDKNKVVGYALCMHPIFGDKIELLKSMFVEIEKILPKETSFIVMGQICIDKEYRGQGLFRKLYATMADAVLPEFDVIITEVDAKNTRSLNAHYAVGFKELNTHISNGQEWKMIALK